MKSSELGARSDEPRDYSCLHISEPGDTLGGVARFRSVPFATAPRDDDASSS